MSEATIAAPVAPVESTPAPTAPQTSPETPAATQAPESTSVERKAPQTLSQARKDVLARIRASQATREAAPAPTDAAAGGSQTPADTPPSPTIDATGRAHDPANGQFTTPPAADAAGATDPAATQPGEAPATTPAATQQTRRIELPADHPLRHQGLTDLEAPDERTELAIRALLNGTYTRTQEVTALRQQLADRDTELRRLQAQVAVRSEWNRAALDDGTMANYEAMKEVNPEAAEVYLEGAMARLEKKAGEKFTELDQQAQEQAAEREAADTEQRIRGAVLLRAQGVVPSEVLHSAYFPDIMATAEALTEADIATRERMGRLPQDMEQREAEAVNLYGFHLKTTLLNHHFAGPLIRGKAQEAQRAREEAARQQVEAEAQRKAVEAAAQAEREALASAAIRPKANPLGGAPVNVTGVPETEPKTDTSQLTGRRLFDHVRAQMRERAKAYAPQHA